MRREIPPDSEPEESKARSRGLTHRPISTTTARELQGVLRGLMFLGMNTKNGSAKVSPTLKKAEALLRGVLHSNVIVGLDLKGQLVEEQGWETIDAAAFLVRAAQAHVLIECVRAGSLPFSAIKTDLTKTIGQLSSSITAVV